MSTEDNTEVIENSPEDGSSSPSLLYGKRKKIETKKDMGTQTENTFVEYIKTSEHDFQPV